QPPKADTISTSYRKETEGTGFHELEDHCKVARPPRDAKAYFGCFGYFASIPCAVAHPCAADRPYHAEASVGKSVRIERHAAAAELHQHPVWWRVGQLLDY